MFRKMINALKKKKKVIRKFKIRKELTPINQQTALLIWHKTTKI